MNTNAPKTLNAMEADLELLAGARAAFEAGKQVRKQAAKTARRNGTQYRLIAQGLGVSVNRAYTLVNEDTTAPSAALEAAE
jgi:hypothetical protein